MPTRTAALIAPRAGAPFEIGTIERRDLRSHDVAIDIAFVGICHTDIHQVREHWGPASFPMVPGHEITGIVTAVGTDVIRHRVGDRVGVGCFVDSCRECEHCRTGDNQYCLRGCVYTYASNEYDGSPTYGGYSSAIVVDENYVLQIPDNIALDAAAPLLCAGITLYSPLRHWGAGAGTQLAIVGMGGLGHVGVKIGAALGANVTVFSQSLAKKDDGIRFGASDYAATGDPENAKRYDRAFDLLITTVTAAQNIDEMLGMLRLDGTLVFVGIPDGAQQFLPVSLVQSRRHISGSSNGSIRETQEMLDFCAQHSIGAEVERIRADQVDEAYERILASDVRYRFVIDARTIDG